MAKADRSRDEQLFSTLPRARRKALGQYATPEQIAATMASWIDQPGVTTYVDPAVGTGALLRAVAERHGGTTAARLLGGELDEAAAAIARTELAPLTTHGSEVRVGDFFDAPLEPWTAVSCNPPYLNLSKVDRRDDYRAIVARDAGIEFAGAPNLALLFSARLLAFLAPGGRLALLVPSELLDQRTAGPLKAALIARGLLRGVIVFDEAESVFADADTTATVLLLERPVDGTPLPASVALLRVNAQTDPDLLDAATIDRWERLDAGDLADHAHGRWTLVFRAEHQLTLEPDDVRLGEIVTITSPQNTGWDAFFIRSGAEWASLGIDRRHLVPVIAWKRLIPLSGPIDAEWIRAMEAANERIYLLVAPRTIDPADTALAALIETGRQRDDFPKAMVGRATWWALRRPEPAPVYVTSYWQKSDRFAIVRNTGPVVAFATLFAVRPLDSADADRLVADPAVSEALIGARRRLGAGLSKIEVSDARVAIVRGWKSRPRQKAA
jgi:SAM-dependent methyltransferase